MSLDERITWFLLGVLVGLIISWLNDLRRGEREIKEELDEVADIVKEQKRDRDESGFMRFPIVADLVLLSVVIMTVWAAFSTAKTNDELEAQGERQEDIIACVQMYLYGTIEALNERTTYSQSAASSNVELQKGFSDFIDLLLIQPPSTDAEKLASLQAYDQDLENFLILAEKQKGKVTEFPFPTESELSQCLGYDVNTTKEKEQ